MRRTSGLLRAALATVAVMVAVGCVGWFGPRHGMLVAGPVGAAVLLILARCVGLSPADVGLGRRSWRAGAAYAMVCAALVAAVYAAAALVPATRSAFLDQRYRLGVPAALLTALVVVPVGTVLFEEVAFRGVLWGLLRSGWGAVWATAVSSVLFGFWHVVPSLNLSRVNPAVAGASGTGHAGQVLAVAGAVLFTSAAGVLLSELRRRSGSLLAPIGLHWAVNGLAVLVAALMAR